MEDFFLNKKAQVSLEIAIIFISIVLFLLGVIRIWVWSQSQLIGRQKSFNSTRVEAGTVEKEDEIKPLVWPVYKPQKLEEKWVIIKSPLK